MEWVRLTLDHTLTSRKFPCNDVHCKAPYSCQLHTTSLLGINLVPRDPKGLAKRNGIFKFKRAHHFPTHMLISYLKTVIPETLDSYKNAKSCLENLELYCCFMPWEFSLVTVKLCVNVQTFSPVWLFAIPWTVARQAPLCMEFSRQEYWSE